MDITADTGFSEFVADVRDLIVRRVSEVPHSVRWQGGIEQLFPGKMLRTCLAARMLAGGATEVDREVLQDACAAIEMVHTASLCHDDVVDNAEMRRTMPALWRLSGASGAILIGDLVLCEAMQLVVEIGQGAILGEFIAKTKEVVAAEAEQELLWRGKRVDEATCLRLARSKTGPLFAFVAEVCGGGDADLSAALTEAGYRIGTAYQLADDLLDVTGDESSAGKTLGTDSGRRKFTLPQAGAEGQRATRAEAQQLCTSALAMLQPYPRAQGALMEFLGRDLQPVFFRQGEWLAVGKELTA